MPLHRGDVRRSGHGQARSRRNYLSELSASHAPRHEVLDATSTDVAQSALADLEPCLKKPCLTEAVLAASVQRMSANASEAELVALYEETGRVLAQFWGWRHKIIALCGAMLTTILGIAAWMYQRRLGGAVAIPFSFGAFIAYGCWVFDKRNAEIIDDCFQAGKALEEEISAGNPKFPKGIYSEIYHNKPRAGRYTYTETLRRGYLAVTYLLCLCSLIMVGLAIAEPSTITPKEPPQISHR